MVSLLNVRARRRQEARPCVAELHPLQRERAKKADMMFALMPLIFGAQQALEGMVWLNGGEGCGSFAADGFVIFAFVLWPIYTPLACWLSVTVSRPRKILLALVWLGGLMALLGVYALHRKRDVIDAALAA
jgi:hypothetical protein